MKRTHKFKIKNRKKRKYIKRSSPISELSLSKSWLIKFMPYIIMAVGLITTLAITPSSFQVHPIQPVQPIQPIDFDLTKPTVSLNSLLQIFQGITTLISSTLVQLQYLTEAAIAYIAGLANQAVTVIANTLAMIISSIAYVATILWEGISVITSAIIQKLTFLITSLWNFLTLVFNTIATMIQTAIHIISHAIITAFTKIIEWIDAAWYFLTTPFRALVALFMKIKPYLDFVGNTIKESSLFLIESMSMVMGGMK